MAVGRIDALRNSEQDIYDNHVVAFSDLDLIEESYQALQSGYTA